MNPFLDVSERRFSASLFITVLLYRAQVHVLRPIFKILVPELSFYTSRALFFRLFFVLIASNMDADDKKTSICIGRVPSIEA